MEKIPSAIDLNFRDVFEGEEDRASDDVRLGSLERDGEDCEIVSVSSRDSTPDSDVGSGDIGRDVGDVDVRVPVSASTRERGWKVLRLEPYRWSVSGWDNEMEMG